MLISSPVCFSIGPVKVEAPRDVKIDKEKLEALASTWANSPGEGSRPAVQYIKAASRRNKDDEKGERMSKVAVSNKGSLSSISEISKKRQITDTGNSQDVSGGDKRQGSSKQAIDSEEVITAEAMDITHVENDDFLHLSFLDNLDSCSSQKASSLDNLSSSSKPLSSRSITDKTKSSLHRKVRSQDHLHAGALKYGMEKRRNYQSTKRQALTSKLKPAVADKGFLVTEGLSSKERELTGNSGLKEVSRKDELHNSMKQQADHEKMEVSGAVDLTDAETDGFVNPDISSSRDIQTAPSLLSSPERFSSKRFSGTMKKNRLPDFLMVSPKHQPSDTYGSEEISVGEEHHDSSKQQADEEISVPVAVNLADAENDTLSPRRSLKGSLLSDLSSSRENLVEPCHLGKNDSSVFSGNQVVSLNPMVSKNASFTPSSVASKEPKTSDYGGPEISGVNENHDSVKQPVDNEEIIVPEVIDLTNAENDDFFNFDYLDSLSTGNSQNTSLTSNSGATKEQDLSCTGGPEDMSKENKHNDSVTQPVDDDEVIVPEAIHLTHGENDDFLNSDYLDSLSPRSNPKDLPLDNLFSSHEKTVEADHLGKDNSSPSSGKQRVMSTNLTASENVSLTSNSLTTKEQDLSHTDSPEDMSIGNKHNHSAKQQIDSEGMIVSEAIDLTHTEDDHFDFLDDLSPRHNWKGSLLNDLLPSSEQLSQCPLVTRQNQSNNDNGEHSLEKRDNPQLSEGEILTSKSTSCSKASPSGKFLLNYPDSQVEISDGDQNSLNQPLDNRKLMVPEAIDSAYSHNDGFLDLSNLDTLSLNPTGSREALSLNDISLSPKRPSSCSSSRGSSMIMKETKSSMLRLKALSQNRLNAEAYKHGLAKDSGSKSLRSAFNSRKTVGQKQQIGMAGKGVKKPSMMSSGLADSTDMVILAMTTAGYGDNQLGEGMKIRDKISLKNDTGSRESALSTPTSTSDSLTQSKPALISTPVRNISSTTKANGSSGTSQSTDADATQSRGLRGTSDGFLQGKPAHTSTPVKNIYSVARANGLGENNQLIAADSTRGKATTTTSGSLKHIKPALTSALGTVRANKSTRSSQSSDIDSSQGKTRRITRDGLTQAESALTSTPVRKISSNKRASRSRGDSQSIDGASTQRKARRSRNDSLTEGKHQLTSTPVTVRANGSRKSSQASDLDSSQGTVIRSTSDSFTQAKPTLTSTPVRKTSSNKRANGSRGNSQSSDAECTQSKATRSTNKGLTQGKRALTSTPVTVRANESGRSSLSSDVDSTQGEASRSALNKVDSSGGAKHPVPATTKKDSQSNTVKEALPNVRQSITPEPETSCISDAIRPGSTGTVKSGPSSGTVGRVVVGKTKANMQAASIPEKRTKAGNVLSEASAPKQHKSNKADTRTREEIPVPSVPKGAITKSNFKDALGSKTNLKKPKASFSPGNADNKKMRSSGKNSNNRSRFKDHLKKQHPIPQSENGSHRTDSSFEEHGSVGTDAGYGSQVSRLSSFGYFSF